MSLKQLSEAKLQARLARQFAANTTTQVEVPGARDSPLRRGNNNDVGDAAERRSQSVPDNDDDVDGGVAELLPQPDAADYTAAELKKMMKQVKKQNDQLVAEVALMKAEAAVAQTAPDLLAEMAAEVAALKAAAAAAVTQTPHPAHHPARSAVPNSIRPTPHPRCQTGECFPVTCASCDSTHG